jgi:hypothetical protein
MLSEQATSQVPVTMSQKIFYRLRRSTELGASMRRCMERTSSFLESGRATKALHHRPTYLCREALKDLEGRLG